MAIITLTGYLTYADGTQPPFSWSFHVDGTPTFAVVHYAGVNGSDVWFSGRTDLGDFSTDFTATGSPTNVYVTPSATTITPDPPPANFSLTPGQEFTANAWPYKRLADNAPLDPDSTVISQTLYNGFLNSATTVYWYADYPIYVVDQTVPTVRVECGTAPNELELQPFFNAVPMPNPATFQTQGGGDHEVVIYRPSTHEMWEMWGAAPTGATVTDSAGNSVPQWGCSWGGYEANLTTNPGWWGTLPQTGANMGAVAAGVPIVATAVTVADIRRQACNHAVGVIIPQSVCGQWWRQPPAQRGDGVAGPSPPYPQEGMIFRLPANIDLNAYASTVWDGVSAKPLFRIIAEAIRDYGLLIYDQGPNAVMIGESGVSYASDPYVNDPAVVASVGLGWTPFHQITDFPWSQLQLLAPLA